MTPPLGPLFGDQEITPEGDTEPFLELNGRPPWQDLEEQMMAQPGLTDALRIAREAIEKLDEDP